MIDKKKFLYWLTLDEGETVNFSDLAHLIAAALHPGEHEMLAYGAARVNLDQELAKAVRDGHLTVRNPAGLGLHTFPRGEALKRAVLIPNIDLERFLNSRGIGLCWRSSAQDLPKPTRNKKWTDERLEELATFREEHTMQETAQEFGISEQRIRSLLSKHRVKDSVDEKKGNANPLDGWVHRIRK